MRIFRKKGKPPPVVERRLLKNAARRKTFEEDEKRVIQMREDQLKQSATERNRRIELIEANLRAIKRRGNPQ